MTPAAFKRTVFTAGFGRGIQTFREAQSIEQSDLAKRSGLALNVLEAIEAGKHNVTFPDLERLADALKLRPYQLVSLGEAYAAREEQASAKQPTGKGSRRPGKKGEGGDD